MCDTSWQQKVASKGVTRENYVLSIPFLLLPGTRIESNEETTLIEEGGLLI
jgi:hypothetical protein